MVHNEARGVDYAADDEAAGYPVFCDDHMRELVQHPPRGHQHRNQRDCHWCTDHGTAFFDLPSPGFRNRIPDKVSDVVLLATFHEGDDEDDPAGDGGTEQSVLRDDDVRDLVPPVHDGKESRYHHDPKED
jgi:hypothetical protein